MPNPKVEAVSRLVFRDIGHTHKAGSGSMVKRSRASIVTESIDFKPGHSAKTQQAWRYPGGNIVRAPFKMVNGKRYEDPKNPGEARRKHESNFFITINPNKAPNGDDEMYTATKAMEKMLDHISRDATLATYLKFGPKMPEGKVSEEHDYRLDRYTDVIESVDWKAAVETGDVLHRLHAHIWLTITHYSQVQINVKMLQHIVRQEYNTVMPLGVEGKTLRITALPYVHVKLLPQSDWTSVMRQYIQKGMRAS